MPDFGNWVWIAPAGNATGRVIESSKAAVTFDVDTATVSPRDDLGGIERSQELVVGLQSVAAHCWRTIAFRGTINGPNWAEWTLSLRLREEVQAVLRDMNICVASLHRQPAWKSYIG